MHAQNGRSDKHGFHGENKGGYGVYGYRKKQKIAEIFSKKDLRASTVGGLFNLILNI